MHFTIPLVQSYTTVTNQVLCFCHKNIHNILAPFASTIELIHEDKGPSFMHKGESGKPKITKAGRPMIVLFIHNHCVHVHDNLLLDYGIALIKAQMQCAIFLTKLGFVAKQNKDDWRFISQLIETRKYAHLHTP
jgi:hypothetical protein